MPPRADKKRDIWPAMLQALERRAKQHAVFFPPKMGTLAAPVWHADGDFVPAPGMREPESEIEKKFFLSLISNPANPAALFATVKLRVKARISRL